MKKNKRNKKITRQEIIEQRKKDPDYWGQPLIYRLYVRILYALVAFMCTASFFDIFTQWGTIAQCVFGGLVALAVLLWRMAFPEGFGNIFEWIMEGMMEAAKEQEAKGKNDDAVKNMTELLAQNGVSQEKIRELEKEAEMAQKAKDNTKKNNKQKRK